MEDYWTKSIYLSVKDISDIKLQERVWLDNTNGQVSSFVEMINTLYDDNCFEDFLSVKEWDEQRSLGKLHQELHVLKEMIDAYEEPATDAQVLTDAGWKRIVNQAKRTVNVWDHSPLSFYSQAT